MQKIFTLIFTLLFMLFWADLQAQSNTLSSGGQAIGAGGTSSYSIGIIDYISSDGSGGQVSQGLQQPFELFVTEVNGPEEAISARIFPNPSSDGVMVEVPEAGNMGFRFCFTDLNGKEIAQGTVTDNQTFIPLSGISAGSYFITIYRDDVKAKTFQLIKNQ